MNKKLVFDNELEFKNYIKKNYKIIRNFYFDDVDGVDEDTSKDIKGLIADGSLTFEKAADILKNKGFIK